MRRYLEAGRLNSPRGIKGELRFACWCDSPEFLEGVRGMYYVVTGGEKSYRIPVVDEFVKRVSLTDGVVVALIDGLEL